MKCQCKDLFHRWKGTLQDDGKVGEGRLKEICKGCWQNLNSSQQAAMVFSKGRRQSSPYLRETSISLHFPQIHMCSHSEPQRNQIWWCADSLRLRNRPGLFFFTTSGLLWKAPRSILSLPDTTETRFQLCLGDLQESELWVQHLQWRKSLDVKSTDKEPNLYDQPM